MRQKTIIHEFDNLQILTTEQHNTVRAYDEIMSTLRGIDVDDIIAESPAFQHYNEQDH